MEAALPHSFKSIQFLQCIYDTSTEFHLILWSGACIQAQLSCKHHQNKIVFFFHIFPQALIRLCGYLYLYFDPL